VPRYRFHDRSDRRPAHSQRHPERISWISIQDLVRGADPCEAGDLFVDHNVAFQPGRGNTLLLGRSNLRRPHEGGMSNWVRLGGLLVALAFAALGCGRTVGPRRCRRLLDDRFLHRDDLKGTQTFDQAQAATSYSWMWPPSRSCLQTRRPRTGRGSRSGRGSGVLSSRPRWGLRPL
jgi:hypothetical protein